MSKKVDKLVDQRYRRTAECLKYFSIVRERGPHVPVWDDAVLSGRDVDAEYIKRRGMEVPLVIGDGLQTLGLKIPNSSLSELASIIGPDTPVKVIDVGNQEEVDDWTIGEYARFIEGKTREHKILNLISLEISASPLALRVLGPSLVRRQLDWVDGGLWPEQRRTRADASSSSSSSLSSSYPRVQRYLLVASGGAYTDFHVDLGGTSVWYHIVRGEKVFYFVRPSARNMAIYEAWSSSPDQSSLFLPDLIAAAVKEEREQQQQHRDATSTATEGDDQGQQQAHPLAGECFQVHLKAGDTMYIPGGWIHAVYTPKDAVVFGGNFLHFASVGRQLEVFGVENRTRVAKKYRYPYFKQMAWYAITSMLPLARASSNSFDGDQDAELKNDVLYEMYSLLVQPRSLRQWPYLLRACELWIQESDIDDEDKAIFESSAKAAGCASPGDVLREWWELLTERGAEEKEVEETRAALGEGDSYRGLTDIVRRVRDNLSDVMADEAVVKRLASESERFLYRIQYESFLDNVMCPKLEMPDIPFQMPASIAGPKSVKVEPAPTDTAAVTVTASQPKPKLTLKVRRQNAPEGAAANSVSESGDVDAVPEEDEGDDNDEEEDGEGEEEEEEEQGTQDQDGIPVKKLKLRISTKIDEEQRRAMHAVSTPPDAIVSAEAKVPGSTSPIRKHVPRINFRVSATAEAAVASVQNQPKERVAAAHKATNVEMVAEETVGRQRFGTRGIKLSAKFLENATDYFEGDIEDGGVDGRELSKGFAFEATDGRADDQDFDEEAEEDEGAEQGGEDEWSDFGEGGGDDDEEYNSSDDDQRRGRRKRGRKRDGQSASKGATVKKAKVSTTTSTSHANLPSVPLHMTSGSLIAPFVPPPMKSAGKGSKAAASGTKTAASVRQDLLKRLGSKFR